MGLYPILLTVLSQVAAGDPAPPRFIDATDALGLGQDVVPETVGRVAFADLNNDGYPDLVVNRHRVFMNVPSVDGRWLRRFEEIPLELTGLAKPLKNAAAVFVDVDRDAVLDAVIVEFVDVENPNWTDHGQRTGWQRGNGDGTFGSRRPIDTPPRPTISVAAGDVNRDGHLDLYLGNTYRVYGGGYEGFPNDLLMGAATDGRFSREPLPEDRAEFTIEEDAAGRPTFGTAIIHMPVLPGPMLLDMSYGRRWNRAWIQTRDGIWSDGATELGLDGDDVRHGRHPDWLKERAKTDARFDRADEPPFRANGNTFDCAVADCNNDGLLDLFLSEITHGWAGESSDRSRFLMQAVKPSGKYDISFEPDPKRTVDRAPSDPNDPATRNWNQGDMHCALADINHDGRTDLILSSGDYPDNQRLRVYLQAADGRMVDSTEALGIDHDGSQQLSLADVDGDGDLDIVVGQTFNRMTAQQREGRAPQLRLFINEATEGRRSLVLRFRGLTTDVNSMGLGATVSVDVRDGDQVRRMTRTLVGVGGHAGKQDDFVVHFGLGSADSAEVVRIRWPNSMYTASVFPNLEAGHWVVASDGRIQRWGAGTAR